MADQQPSTGAGLNAAVSAVHDRHLRRRGLPALLLQAARDLDPCLQRAGDRAALARCGSLSTAHLSSLRAVAFHHALGHDLLMCVVTQQMASQR